MKFDSDRNTLELDRTAIVLPGNYTIAVHLDDGNDKKKYYIQIVVGCPSDDEVEDASASTGNAYLDKLLARNKDQPGLSKEAPTGWVKSFNETGYAIIEFSQVIIPL